MPVEITLELYAEKALVMPLFTGHVARGLLLHFIRLVDPAASALLHELDVSKPYSVTPIRFRSSSRTENGYVLDPQFPCKVSFRFLKDEYSTYLLNFFQKQNTALIFDTTFQIASMNINCKSYAGLEKEAQTIDRLTLELKTPTYLANLNSNYHYMFPEPVKVFCHLMKCWNQFSDTKTFSKEEYITYKEWLQKNVGVSKYELQTRLVVMRDKKATGFMGIVTYKLDDKENPYNKTTCMLAKYAEYANIGGNKTAAYGQTKVW
ncbi:MAG: CRISPR system precrRNA processing endoribonuclease RAMP protein Cas6 [Nitrososphaerota archaeon]|jgi:CRISPR-associated endoribonuclease Cas6|nr:CRISPR system precrRNA processing endoribonuclease RAMP protein Cas6 [Nitrososphaerota archaeon]